MNDYTKKEDLIVTIQTLGETLYYPTNNLRKRCKVVKMLLRYEEKMELHLEFEDKIVTNFLHWLDTDELLLNTIDELLTFCYLGDYLDCELNNNFYLQFCHLMKNFGYQQIEMINWYLTHACDKTIIKECLKPVICVDKQQISSYYKVIPVLKWSFVTEVMQFPFLAELNEIYNQYINKSLEYYQLRREKSDAINKDEKNKINQAIEEKARELDRLFNKYGKKSLVYATTL